MVRKYPLRCVATDSDELNFDNDIVGVTPNHHVPGSSDERGVARKYPLRCVASDRDVPNVDNDIVCGTPSHYEPGPSDE